MPIIGKYFYSSLIYPRSTSPFLGNFVAQHCIQEVLRPSLEKILLASTAKKLLPFLGNFIAQHCIQEAPRPSLEFFILFLFKIYLFYFIAHQYIQESPHHFLGISLLNVASKKRNARPWKIFLSLINTLKKRLALLRNSIAHYCIQEALRPSLEICSPI